MKFKSLQMLYYNIFEFAIYLCLAPLCFQYAN